MRNIVLAALILLSFAPSLVAQPGIGDEEIIQAFIECPEIIDAHKELLKNSYPVETPRIILSNYHCGAVGCQHSYLVVQQFERKRVNPFITHIMGIVHVGPKGNITRVERVDLVPTNEM